MSLKTKTCKNYAGFLLYKKDLMNTILGQRTRHKRSNRRFEY